MLVIFHSVLAADILLKIVSQKELSLETYGPSGISPNGWREPGLSYNYTEHFFLSHTTFYPGESRYQRNLSAKREKVSLRPEGTEGILQLCFGSRMEGFPLSLPAFPAATDSCLPFSLVELLMT